MPRPSRPWFRFYVEAVHDRKLRRLTPAQRWLWVACLAAARQSPIAGLLLVSERDAMDAADLADIAGMPEREVAAALPLFERAGMLQRDETLSAWMVTNWADRQYESDVSTERVQRHRAVTETPMKRSNDVAVAVPGTPPETEADTDTPLVPPSAESWEGIHELALAKTVTSKAADPACIQCQGRGVKGYALIGEKLDKTAEVPCDCTLEDYEPRPERAGPPDGWVDPLKARRGA